MKNNTLCVSTKEKKIIRESLEKQFIYLFFITELSQYLFWAFFFFTQITGRMQSSIGFISLWFC